MAKLAHLTLALTAALFLGVATSASASTQIGSTCSADIAGPGPVVSRSHVAPFSGVITSWGINITPGSPPPSSTQYLLVLDNTGANSWQIKGLSAPVVMSSSIIKATRLPITAGQAIAAWGSGGWSFTCLTLGGGGDFEFGNFGSVPTVGRTFSTTSSAEETSAVWARIEPDVDADGFGDESQDGCPASAQFSIECPAPAVKPKVLVSKSGLVLSFEAEAETNLNITGVVALPSGAGKARLKKTAKVLPGQTTKIKLKHPAKLRQALRSLPRSRSLKLSLKIQGSSLGTSATKKIVVKLKGQR